MNDILSQAMGLMNEAVDREEQKAAQYQKTEKSSEDAKLNQEKNDEKS